MSAYKDALRRYAAATAVSPTLRPRRPSRAPWVVLPLAAAAAVALLWPRPTPVSTTFQDHGEMALGDAVTVRWEGEGSAAGTSRALDLRWSSGWIDVEVEPDHGVELAVATDEGRVQVVGTGFEVRRDAFGTHVVVRHGVVTLACAGGGERRVSADQEAACDPVSPAAWLGRARAELRRGDPPDTVLRSLGHARVGATGDVLGEVDLLEAVEVAAGTPEAALPLIDAALPRATSRRIELLRLGARLAWDLGGCPRALPYTTPLAATGEPTPCTEPTR